MNLVEELWFIDNSLIKNSKWWNKDFIWIKLFPIYFWRFYKKWKGVNNGDQDYIYMIKISGKVDKSNSYNELNGNISFFINRRTSSEQNITIKPVVSVWLIHFFTYFYYPVRSTKIYHFCIYIYIYIYISEEIDLVWFSLVLWHIKHCRLFNAKSIFIHKTVLFQIIQLT